MSRLSNHGEFKTHTYLVALHRSGTRASWKVDLSEDLSYKDCLDGVMALAYLDRRREGGPSDMSSVEL